MDWLRLLDRISATRSEPTLETLRYLQRRAMESLPFENLDIHLGRPIELDPNALYEKIVVGKRGGFCFELNECFYQCLRALGYEVDRMEARVELGGSGSPFDHQWTLVRLNGSRWMADIGMGDSSLSPLSLDSPEPQSDGRSLYRVVERENDVEILRQFQEGEWTKMLVLSLTPHRWTSFKSRCHWHQSSSDSVFAHKRTCTLATHDGRVTLTGNTLRKSGDVSSEGLIEEEDYLSVLELHFGISLGSPTWTRPVSS